MRSTTSFLLKTSFANWAAALPTLCVNRILHRVPSDFPVIFSVAFRRCNFPGYRLDSYKAPAASLLRRHAEVGGG